MAESNDVGAFTPTKVAQVERYCPRCEASFPDGTERCPNDNTLLVELGEEDSLIGAVIDGRFTIESQLGAGGMGTAYRALQHSVGRPVAVKVIHRRLSRDRRAAKRFLREAKLASQLAHPNTVTVLDFGQTPDKRLFMVMEMVEGPTLEEILEKEGAFAPERAIEIAIQICDALEAAAELDIIHRDLKPSNIILIERRKGRDFVKVLDFGLAKSLAGDQTTVTESMSIMGTPQYLPPEVAVGGAADHRSDLYSLGVLLYEMLTGEVPFTAETAQALLFMHVNEEPPKLPAHVPQELREIVACLLAKEPEHRIESAASLRAALQQCLPGTETGHGRMVSIPGIPRAVPIEEASERPRWLMGIVLFIVAGMSVVGLMTVVDGGDRDSSAPVTSTTPAELPSKAAVEAAELADNTATEDIDIEPPPGDVDISFVSRPGGADVYYEGKKLCSTPCTAAIPPGQSRNVLFRRKGYEDLNRDFTAIVGAAVDVELEALPGATTTDDEGKADNSAKERRPNRPRRPNRTRRPNRAPTKKSPPKPEPEPEQTPDFLPLDSQ